MSKFRPFVTFHEDRPKSSYHKNFNEYPTYRALKKDLPNIIAASDGNFSVYRSKRGEWGEWFERYEDGKIVKQGWM